MSDLNISGQDKSAQIKSLRDTITSAEKTIQSAKAMLLQLEGKKRVGRHKKTADEGENVVYGTFDGQVMMGDDGKQYPVPANYASKSKLVQGDMLKLTVEDGRFLYKQVGPVERKNLIGIAGQDETGNYFVMAEGKPYKVILASVTYFKIEPGDEVVISVPADMNSDWAAIENVLRKNEEMEIAPVSDNGGKLSLDMKENVSSPTENSSRNETVADDEKSGSTDNFIGKNDFMDEWSADLEAIKAEIKGEEK